MFAPESGIRDHAGRRNARRNGSPSSTQRDAYNQGLVQRSMTALRSNEYRCLPGRHTVKGRGRGNHKVAKKTRSAQGKVEIKTVAAVGKKGGGR